MQLPGGQTVDLNVTPLIDVLLVLLVIFMMTLPLTEQKLDTTVPPRTQTADAIPPSDQIVVRYEVSGQISINTQPVTLAELPTRLQAVYRDRYDKTLYIMGDAKLRYGAIVKVMDIAKGAGIARVGIITEGMRRAG